MGLAAVAVAAGAAAGAQASSASSASSAGSAAPGGDSAAAPAALSSANDPHEVAAQREAARIVTTFQTPPGTTKASTRPDPVPSGLQGPPLRSAAATQATAVAWYYSPESPDQVLAWVWAHPPTGSSWSGSGSGSVGPSFLTFSYPTPQSSLIVTPQSGPDGRTVIRLDASVVWNPLRDQSTLLGYGATSVSVVTTNQLNPRQQLPAAEAVLKTSTDPAVVHKVVDLLNALQPPIPGTRHCAMDDGTRVRITLPGEATVDANPVGCDEVTVTPQGGAPENFSGGDLVPQIYALFGVTWSRSSDLPAGTGTTGAFGTR
ncbi:hypothetical protein [Catenulispora pinisilvae]|uniref:hypothetical protein n=1 Tax=Catenulispora pinisilvae TaxID=2705253 RepID=UPI001892088C|nr:hypothetical protein [Catenulispora pinisilvae]